MLIQFIVFPPVARRLGILNCLKICTLSFPLVYLLTPFTALLPTPLTQQTAMFAVMFCKCWGVIFAFPCSTILLTNSAVSLRILGTLNGVATSVSALGRAAGPAIGGSTFSLGVDTGYVIVPWWILAALAAIGAVPVWWLVEMEGFGGASGDSDSEDSDLDENDDGGDFVIANTNNDHDHDADEDYIATTTPFLSTQDTYTITEEPDSFDPSDDLPPSTSRKTLSTNSRNHSMQRIPTSASASASASLSVNSQIHRRMSSPIGMRQGLGPGGGRRLSNGLGPTRSGWEGGGGILH